MLKRKKKQYFEALKCCWISRAIRISFARQTNKYTQISPKEKKNGNKFPGKNIFLNNHACWRRETLSMSRKETSWIISFTEAHPLPSNILNIKEKPEGINSLFRACHQNWSVNHNFSQRLVVRSPALSGITVLSSLGVPAFLGKIIAFHVIKLLLDGWSLRKFNSSSVQSLLVVRIYDLCLGLVWTTINVISVVPI